MRPPKKMLRSPMPGRATKGAKAIWERSIYHFCEKILLHNAEPIAPSIEKRRNDKTHGLLCPPYFS